MTHLAEALRRRDTEAVAAHADVAPAETPALDPSELSAAPFAAFQGCHPSTLEKLVIAPNANGATVEQYRKLAAALHHLQLVRGSRIVMLASAAPGEGKTLTAANLALTLSQSYRRRVLLIDADLRNPNIHHVFQVPNVTGLNEGLKSADDQKLCLIQISAHLSVLPAGRPDPDPMGSLASERMR